MSTLQLFMPVIYILSAWAVVNLWFWLRPSRQTEETGNPTTNVSAVAVELVSPLHLRVTSNTLGGHIMTWVEGPIASSRLGSWLLQKYYNLGVCVGVASMLVCTGVLLFAGMQIFSELCSRLCLPGAAPLLFTLQNNSVDLVERQTVDVVEDGIYQRGQQQQHQQQQQQSQVLLPIIPGVTLPLAHIWYYLLALIFCAGVHEAGHALAAACAGIKPQRIGMFLMGVYPGAFVEVAREELERLPVGAQLRVVCAGVWHNAATALLIWLLMVSGGLWWILGSTLWSPVTDGVVITEMDAASPLLGRLPLLSTVYRIDDVCLAPGDTCLGGLVNGTVGAPEARYGTTAIARWTNILMRSKSNRELASGGYCVSLNDNMDDGLCCEMTAQHPLGESPDGRLYCFEPYKVRLLENREPMCFDLHLVLQRQSSQRCRDHGDCSIQGDFGSEHQTVCALPSSPYASSRVMRLYYRTLAGVDDMVIYVGSPKGLWLDVRVSTLVPRWPGVRSLLGGGVELMPRRVESLLQYVLSFSVAFCLLNALPAWHLDGEHILRLVMLSLLGASSRSGSGGSGEDSVVALRGVGERIHWAVTAMATALLGWCILGSFVLLAI